MFWGIDGCKNGWIAIGLDEQSVHCEIYATINEFWAAQGATCERLLLDMPIGLPDTNGRQVEALARQHLKKRRSSVFEVPSREALKVAVRENFADYAYSLACDRNAEILGKRFSKQSWNILPKIHEVDTFLQSNPSAKHIFKEAHPELLFWALNAQQAMQYSKKMGLGFTERLHILEQYIPNAFDKIRTIYDVYQKSLVDDDIVDALVCAICARFSNLQSLPQIPETDATGLPMQMVYPAL